MPDPYIAQLGRISGALLNANLLRNGEDLSFRNGPTDDDLLYLDVSNGRIGINSAPPTVELDLTGLAKVNGNVIVDGTRAIVDNVIINTNNTFSTTVGPLIIAPTGPDAYVEYGRVLNTDLELKDNFIRTLNSNQNLELDTSGTGIVDILASTAVNGTLGVTGNINSAGTVQLDGQFIIGDSPIDTVTISPDFTQSIIPGDNAAYDFGQSNKRWNELFVDDISNADSINTNSVIVSQQTLYAGNTISTIQSNDDLVLSSNTGTVQLESISINQGVINNLLNSNIVINHTGNGYLVINDTNAMGIPVGDVSQRPGLAVGETRWNNQLGYLECFDGTVWQVATGGGTVVTPAVMEELGNVYTLIFG